MPPWARTTRVEIGILRRSVLRGIGLAAGGLALGLFEASASAATVLAPNPFVHVASDGAVTIVCHRAEMGQGIRGTLAALIADELGADLARVRVTQADGDAIYGDQATDGSNSIRSFYLELRKTGATARAMLVRAAARRWRVPEASCHARDHEVRCGDRAIGFGALVAHAARLPVPRQVTLRPRGELAHLGKAIPLVDAPDIVTGRAVYGADVRLPGMLVAVALRPPVLGGKLARHDASRALAVPGVRRVIELPVPSGPPQYQPLGGLAVVADHTWAALCGRAALDVAWDHGPNAHHDSAAARSALTAAVRAPGQVVRKVGDVDRTLARAARIVEAEYHVPHLAHAAMEPPAAIARVVGDHCEVWAPTQDGQDARAEVARALGWKLAQVTVHVTLLGGAFGRKAKPDYCAEAALLARAMGAPVRMQWTRDDDLRNSYYHTVSAQRLTAGLDAQGRITAWRHRSAFPSIGSTFEAGVTHGAPFELEQGLIDQVLAVPNLQCESCAAEPRVRIGWVRSVNNLQHGFAVAGFLDELAHARGVDPRAQLLEAYGPDRRITTPADLGLAKLGNYRAPLAAHPLDTARLRAVIERVTASAGWDRRAGRALGLACHRSFLAYVAVVASVTRVGGKLRVDEVWLAIDAGLIINPDRARAQMEGSVLFGLSLALYGEITLRDGAVAQSNFHDYRLARMVDAPRAIHVDLVPSDAPPGGIGEPGVPPVAPAICNAVFALTGTRVRDLPLARAGLA